MLYALAVAAACLLASRGLIHYFQLESYQFPGYFRTLKRNWKNAIASGAALCLVMLALHRVWHGMGDNRADHGAYIVGMILAAVGTVAFGAAVHLITKKQKAKKALVFTPRVKRLYAVALVVFALLCCLVPENMLFLFPLLLPVWVALAGLLAWPIRYVLAVAGLLADFPLAAVYTKRVYIVFWLGFVYLLLLVFLLMKKKQPGVLLCCGTLGLCLALLASWVENGEYPDHIPTLGAMVQDICCGNALRYFNLENKK